MSSTADAVTRAPSPRHGAWTGRGGLVLAGLMLALGIYLTLGIVTMEVPEGAESPGPTFVPTIVAVGCYLLAALIAWQTWRHPEDPTHEEPLDAYGGEHATFSDWRAVGICVLGFLAFALLLQPLGWILAAALLFWSVAVAMGSSKGLTDVAVALVMSSVVQLAFSAGLGLNLPAGILEGVV